MMLDWLSGPELASATDVLIALGSVTLKASLLLLIAGAVTLALPRMSAAERHLVWKLAVVGALALPVVTSLVPGVSIALPFPRFPSAETRGVAPIGEAPRGFASPPATPAAGGATVVHAGPGEAGAIDLDASATVAVHGNEGSIFGSGPAISGGSMDAATFRASAAASLSRWLPIAAVALWGIGVLSVLGSLLLGTFRLALIERRALVLRSSPVQDAAARISRRIGLRRTPVLLLGGADAIPMTWGIRRPRVLLPAQAVGWDARRLEGVLVHELAHVRRRDSLAQLTAQLACAAYWFNPLVWIAADRMHREREHACDDLVVSWGRDASGYAHDLIDLSRACRTHLRMDAAALAMARPSHLKARLIALLDPHRSRRPLGRRQVVAALAVALPVLVMTAAASPERAGAVQAESGRAELGQAEPPQIALADPPPVVARAQEAPVLCGPADGEQTRGVHNTSNDRITIEQEYGRCRSTVRIEGVIDFTTDFARIARMGSGAAMTIEVDRGGVERRMEVRRGNGGEPVYTWRVDGETVPFDGQAQAWLDAALVDVFRSTSYRAGERARWMLSERGVDGVLSEVERLRSDHVRASYLGIVLEHGGLTAAEVGRVLALAGSSIDSDHSLGQVLIAAASRYTLDGSAREDFLRAAASIQSDHTQGQVFERALAWSDVSGEQLAALLQAAAVGIDSDHTMGQLLQGLATRYPLEPALRAPFLAAVATIQSDHTKGQVYERVLRQTGLTGAELAEVLAGSTTIDSDHTLGQVLEHAARHDLSEPALRAAYLEAARSIQSDHTRSQVFEAALELEGLSGEDLAAILSGAATIGSDSNLAGLLEALAEGGLASVALQRAYLDAAANIESDHFLRRALEAFIAVDGVGAAEQVHLLRIAREIASDAALAGVLLDFLGRYPVEGEVHSEFLQTLESVSSEHYHGRVSSALLRPGGR
jgi:beta-lactamase regulating signal transducer with metallopeptidase domain